MTYKKQYDHRYRAARRKILGPSGGGVLLTDPPCHWCGEPASEADHEPPISVTGHTHLHLVPACTTCNRGRRNSKRKVADTPSRPW